MNKKIVIISGGELEEEFVLSILEKEENLYVIGVDKGMEFLTSLCASRKQHKQARQRRQEQFRPCRRFSMETKLAILSFI